MDPCPFPCALQSPREQAPAPFPPLLCCAWPVVCLPLRSRQRAGQRATLPRSLALRPVPLRLLPCPAADSSLALPGLRLLRATAKQAQPTSTWPRGRSCAPLPLLALWQSDNCQTATPCDCAGGGNAPSVCNGCSKRIPGGSVKPGKPTQAVQSANPAAPSTGRTGENEGLPRQCKRLVRQPAGFRCAVAAVQWLMAGVSDHKKPPGGVGWIKLSLRGERPTRLVLSGRRWWPGFPNRAPRLRRGGAWRHATAPVECPPLSRPYWRRPGYHRKIVMTI
jgi:hypothetical protein